MSIATRAKKRKCLWWRKENVMKYTKPALDMVGTASTLIQGPVGHPTDPSGAGLKINDVVPSKVEEE